MCMESILTIEQHNIYKVRGKDKPYTKPYKHFDLLISSHTELIVIKA